ncbi:MAG: hypothetical protein JXQ87_07205 [Bacteroidia bacterium]
MKFLFVIAQFVLIPCGALAQHPILTNLFIDDEFDGGIRISFTIGGGNTCNGIRIYHSTDTSIGFSQIGEIPGICGDSDNDMGYSFVHEAPKDFDTNYYYLEFGGQGNSSVFAHFYFGEQKEIKWLIASNEIRFYEPLDQPLKSVQIVDFNGKNVKKLAFENGYWSSGVDQLMYAPLLVIFGFENGSIAQLKISVIK